MHIWALEPTGASRREQLFSAVTALSTERE